MPVAAAQPTGKRSKRGRLSEGRPTKCTPEVTACIAESISLGLTDHEAAAIAGVSLFTLSRWRRDPEFSDALRKATAIRLQNRLKTIESRVDNWQAVGWLVERQLPSRFARPEIQLNLIQQNNVTANALSITISAAEVKQIEDAASTERQNVREMFARYRQGAVDYGNGGEKRLLDVEAEQVETESTEDEAVRKRARDKFAQYNPEQPARQMPIVRKDGDEMRTGFWDLFASGDTERAVEYNTARFVAKEIVRLCLGPKAAQSVAFDPSSICVADVLAEIQRLSGPAGWALINKKSGYIAHSS